MPRPSQLSPDNILRFLQVSREPVSSSDISRGLHLKKSDARPLNKMLAKLKKRRAIEELPGERYRLPGRKTDRQGGQPPSDGRSTGPGKNVGAGAAIKPHDTRDEVKG